MSTPLDPLSHLTNWNPLRGLDIPSLVTLLEEGDRGAYARVQWLYRFILKRNATARAIRRKLDGSIRELDWSVKIRADIKDADKPIAERQKQVLEDAYSRIDNLRAAYTHLAMADILGFAHCEKIYRGDDAAHDALEMPEAAGEGDEQPEVAYGATPSFGGDLTVTLQDTTPLPRDPRWDVVELRCVPQYHWSRRGPFTPWTYDPAAHFGIAVGAEIKDAQWIIHEIPDPAAEIFAKGHLLEGMTEVQWASFLDSYGDPSIFLEGPPNVAKDREAEYQAVAERTLSASRGYLPNGARVHSVDAPTGHSHVFTERLDWIQRQMVLAGTGGLLTMLAEPTGIGKGASDAHDDTWLTIAAGIAAGVSEVLQKQFDEPELARVFGEDVVPLVYFELSKPEKSDVKTTAEMAQLIHQAGFQMDPAKLGEEIGFKLTPLAAPMASQGEGLKAKGETPAPSAPAAPAAAQPPDSPSPSALRPSPSAFHSGSAVPSTTHSRASGTCSRKARSAALRCSAYRKCAPIPVRSSAS